MRIAPIVHQYDRCPDWIYPFFDKYDKEIFGGPLDQQKTVSWKAEAACNVLWHGQVLIVSSFESIAHDERKAVGGGRGGHWTL